MSSMLWRLGAATALVSGLLGCAYGGGDMGDPLTRKFHWLSYVGGDDIRKTCAVGGPDRFRIVYNGVYAEQVRMYDFDAAQKVLAIHVTAPGRASKLSTDNLTGPWQAEGTKVSLDGQTYDRLVAAFAAAGMFGPPAVGLRLDSNGYFWTAAYCHDGHFGVTAWKYPSPEFDHLGFERVLQPLDSTGIAIAPPGPPQFDAIHADERNKGLAGDFTLEVGRDGLVR